MKNHYFNYFGWSLNKQGKEGIKATQVHDETDYFDRPPVFETGEFKVFKHRHQDAHMYVKGNAIFSILVGLNIPMVEKMATGGEPASFIEKRCFETIQKIEALDQEIILKIIEKKS